MVEKLRCGLKGQGCCDRSQMMITVLSIDAPVSFGSHMCGVAKYFFVVVVNVYVSDLPQLWIRRIPTHYILLLSFHVS